MMSKTSRAQEARASGRVGKGLRRIVVAGRMGASGDGDGGDVRLAVGGKALGARWGEMGDRWGEGCGKDQRSMETLYQ